MALKFLTLPSTSVTSAAPLLTRRRNLATVKTVLDKSSTLYSSLKDLFQDTDSVVKATREHLVPHSTVPVAAKEKTVAAARACEEKEQMFGQGAEFS